jgi:hypothetical protein
MVCVSLERLLRQANDCPEARRINGIRRRYWPVFAGMAALSGDIG